MNRHNMRGCVAAICLMAAATIFGGAVWSGVSLIEMHERPTRVLLNKMIERRGAATDNSVEREETVQTRIALMIAALAAASGVGLHRGLCELWRCFR